MDDYRNKVAVITGAASGIGLGMAQAFAAAGMRVVLSDVEQPTLERAAAELRAAGADVLAVAADVSRPEQVDVLARATLERYGAVDILCNNAGVSAGTTPSWNSTLDDWHWVLGVNLMGVVHGIRTFLPLMLAQSTPVHIVNTASMAGLMTGGNPIYAASKAGVVALSENLHLELQRTNPQAHVSLLCPGFVATKILDSQRNRPATFGDASALSNDPAATALREQITEQVRNGLDPVAVGELVLTALREKRFYIFTHPEWLAQVASRTQTMVKGENPRGAVIHGLGAPVSSARAGSD